MDCNKADQMNCKKAKAQKNKTARVPSPNQKRTEKRLSLTANKAELLGLAHLM
jgi:hypothetical protein